MLRNKSYSLNDVLLNLLALSFLKMNQKKFSSIEMCTLKFANCISRSCGFTLIEVIIAITIMSISLVMVMQLFSGSLRASRVSCDYTRAVVHAKDKMEELSVDPVGGSGEFEDGFRWESEVGPYEDINTELEDTGYNILKIKVKVIWSNIGNQEKSIELVSLKTVEREQE